MRWTGRCKKCRGVVSLVLDIARAAGGHESVVLPSNGSPARVHWSPKLGKHFAANCWCGSVATFAAIRGTVSTKHKCDSRCLNAKGHDCECSCGGKNHGAGFGVEIARTPARPAPEPSQVNVVTAKRVVAHRLEKTTGERVFFVTLPDGRVRAYTAGEGGRTIFIGARESAQEAWKNMIRDGFRWTASLFA